MLSSEGISYLVIFGGASSALGVQGDTVYGTLPSLESLDVNSLFVEWKSMTYASSLSSPCAREMHSSCINDNHLYVIGGRNHRGEFIDDVWTLHISSTSLIWTKKVDMTLPLGRCSHGAGAIQISSESKYICIFGGLTAAGSIDDTFLFYDIGASASSWVSRAMPMSITGRFGMAMSSITSTEADDSLIIFGGVNADLDFNDAYLVQSTR